ncbi:hypothetical protein [Nostoc linckia]|uniref:hypothetical protein n=1 Tax=Nostoc linckia TaxID=92942 RepID=UPI00117E2411|nr:hypothetical protein [Nostoc linckia]
MGSRGDGEQGRWGDEFFPSAQCPMPHAPCPMPHAPCPIPIAYFLGVLKYVRKDYPSYDWSKNHLQKRRTHRTR